MNKINPHAVIQTTDIGRDIRIDEFAVIRAGSRIGNHVVIHSHVVINDGVTIGDGSEIFPGAVLGIESGATHEPRTPEIKRRLAVGPNCAIGPHAIIFYGVEIEENTKIEAGAIVKREIPPPGELAPSSTNNDIMVHNCALLESCHVGAGTRIWAYAHILPGARIGSDCNICDQTFIENDVVIGDRVTVKSGVHIWDGVRIEDDVFIGPDVAFTNDLYPRSKQYPDAFLKTVIQKGASIGANATLLPGITIGENAMVGAGAVVTRDVPANALVTGNPARIFRSLENDKETT